MTEAPSTATTDVDVTITRVFDAPRERVWKVWTQPEYFARWFGAPLPSVSIDLRPGGAWSATVATPGGEFPLGGVYREVVEYERLVWTMDLPSVVVMTATFTDLGDRTEAVYHQAAGSEQECEQAREGAAQILDRFAEVLATV